MKPKVLVAMKLVLLAFALATIPNFTQTLSLFLTDNEIDESDFARAVAAALTPQVPA
jgi:hypothetical protein